MIRLRDALVVLLGAAVLFFYYGAAQVLPWGAGSARNFSSTSGAPYVSAGQLTEGPEGVWVTEAFESEFVDGVSTLATDRTFSWIFSVPSERYDLGRYFGFHAVTQVVVALMLFVALRLLAHLPRSRRMLTVGCLVIKSTENS